MDIFLNYRQIVNLCVFKSSVVKSCKSLSKTSNYSNRYKQRTKLQTRRPTKGETLLTDPFTVMDIVSSVQSAKLAVNRSSLGTLSLNLKKSSYTLKFNPTSFRLGPLTLSWLKVGRGELLHYARVKRDRPRGDPFVSRRKKRDTFVTETCHFTHPTSLARCETMGHRSNLSFFYAG